MHIYVYVALRWHRLIRFRRVAVWVCVFVWESINRYCVQRMSDKTKSSGVRDQSSGRKNEFGLSPAAATLPLAESINSCGSTGDTVHWTTIGLECFCRSQRFNDNQHHRTNGIHA